MSTLAIIAEYNPFHNGHLYQLENAKAKTGADSCIALISGNFTQRGQTSLIDKWQKAELALKNGVDLVLELPVIYSISSAENFANGAITLLNSLKNVNYLSFGVEDDDINALKKLANVFVNEPIQYKRLLKEELDKGISFPKARSNAIGKYMKDKYYEHLLEGSNNILAIEYLKALKRQHSKIKPVCVKREKVVYNDNSVIDEFASASGIRQLIENKEYDSMKKVVPLNTYYKLMSNIKNKTIVENITSFEKTIIYKLRTSSLSDLKKLPEVNEGLENLIKTVSEKNNNLIDLINDLKSKRYTQTRIQRILLYSLLDITKKDMTSLSNIVPYARVLGFTTKGKQILSQFDWKITTITSVKKFINNNNNNKFQKMLDIDMRATNIYTIAYDKNSPANLDLTTPIVNIK